jgi:DNA-binding transcriptional regulator YiaG
VDRLKPRRSTLRVKDIRLALAMTQRDFAYQLRVAVPTVSNWETGKTSPSGLADRAIRDLCAREGIDWKTCKVFV